jgi:hypothetical protein
MEQCYENEEITADAELYIQISDGLSVRIKIFRGKALQFLQDIFSLY